MNEMKSKRIAVGLVCLFLGGLSANLDAAIDDYAAYFPFDGDSISRGTPAIELDSLGASSFDETEKIAGKASSRIMQGGNGWRLTEPGEIERLVPKIFTFSGWFRLADDRRPGIAHILHRWTGDRETRIFSFAIFAGLKDLYGVEATVQGTGGGVTGCEITRETWYHAVFRVNGAERDPGMKNITVYLTPKSEPEMNAKPLRSQNFPNANDQMAIHPEPPLHLQSSFGAPGCCGVWLDEAVFYPRVLSEEELGELFKLGKNGRGLPPVKK